MKKHRKLWKKGMTNLVKSQVIFIETPIEESNMEIRNPENYYGTNLRSTITPNAN